MDGKKKLIHKLAEFPLVSLSVGTLLSGYLFFAKGPGIKFYEALNDRDIIKEKIFYGLLSFCTVISTGLIYSFLTKAKRIKDPTFLNYLKYTFNLSSESFSALELFKSEGIDEKIKALEENRGLLRNEGLLDLRIGSLYARKGKLEKGIEYFKRSFNNLSQDELDGFIEIEENLLEKLLRRKCKRKISKNPLNLESYFTMISAGLTRRNINESIDYWEKLCNLDLNQKIDFNVLFALFLDSLENNKLKYKLPKKSSEQWRKTIELVLEVDNKFEPIGVESRNNVFICGPSEFLKSTFVFKKNREKNDFKSKEELKRDFEINKELYKLTEKDKEIKVARPLAFFKDINEYTFNVTQRKPLRNLEDVFDNSDNEEKEDKLKLALENQRRIHRISREHLTFNGGIYFGDSKTEIKPYDYRANLKRRLLERVGINNDGLSFVEAILEEININGYNTLIHGDLSLPNLLEDGTEIDFEKASIGNPVIDSVTTLEDPKNGDIKKEEIFREAYLKDVDGLEREFLEESYKPHAIFISACQVGSKVKQSEDSEKRQEFGKARKHIERAIGFQKQVIEKATPKVKDRFVRYIRSSQNPKARELQACL